MTRNVGMVRGVLLAVCAVTLFGCSEPPPTSPEGPPSNTGPGFSIRFPVRQR